MVVIDATILLLLLRPGTRAPTDAEGLEIEKPKERIEHLIQKLQKQREKIIIPTPALSEALVRAGNDASLQIVEYLNKYAIFRIEPFDTRAGIELATMSREALGRSGKKGGATGVWAKVKFDRQIVAIAKVAGATEIYSDDSDIAAIVKGTNIKVIGLANLPLPDEDPQLSLKLEGHTDTKAAALQDDNDPNSEDRPAQPA